MFRKYTVFGKHCISYNVVSQISGFGRTGKTGEQYDAIKPIRFVSPSGLKDSYWEGQSAMSPERPCTFLLGGTRMQGPYHSLLDHISDLSQAILRYRVR